MADDKKRARDDPAGSSESKRVRTEFLDILDDDSDPEPASHDIDSVFKTLEDELVSSASLAGFTESNSEESRPDLGYLQEASDDELGLPPPSDEATNDEAAGGKNGGEESLSDLVRVLSDSSSSGIGEFWEFDDEIPSYDSFDLRVGEGYSIDYVALDGLFDHSDFLREETVPVE